jgi:nitrate reductase gamma subunit
MLVRFVCGAIAVFAILVIGRVIRIASLPVHLRWELYPVAHEKNASYGGSFFENLNWWTHKRSKSTLGELKVMVPEIVLLKAVYEHNRSLWYRTFPFHFGLYVLALFVLLLAGGGLAAWQGLAIGADATATGAALHWATKIAGVGGLALLLLGALALLWRRISDPALRVYSAPADYLNLSLFIALAVLGLAALTQDPDFVQLRSFMQALLTGQFDAPIPPLIVTAEIALASVVLAYIPATHMAHFFTKWFMYHGIRWDDRANVVGSALERRIVTQLGYKVDWAADHIRGLGRKTWVDVATEKQEKKS